MGIKTFGGRLLARWRVRKIRQWSRHPVRAQQQVFQQLISNARETTFGQEHDFSQVNSYQDFKSNVPLRDYEALRPYIDQIKQGYPDVLWPGRPLYFSKTSGTTSGAKYIPITKESVAHHYKTARDAVLSHCYKLGDFSLLNGKMIFLSGSPVLKDVNGIPTGRLSGIVHHHVPNWLQQNRLPSWDTNCIEDWEEKLDAVIEETLTADMRLISGIPPWIQMYFDRVEAKTGQKMKEIWPNLQLLVHGGVNFRPYRKKLQESIGGPIHFLETFPASEGFLAYQDVPGSQQLSAEEDGLLLQLNSGIFYEFVPLERAHEADPPRLSLQEVEQGQPYALILNTNAGLWGYRLGDTVEFVSRDPFRVKVTGRTKHFISAFGEHVIAKEVEQALLETAQEVNQTIVEFTVAPMVKGKEEASYHEWFVEFGGQGPESLTDFIRKIDQRLQQQNPYYEDLRTGHILQLPKLNVMQKNAFRQYMKQQGRLGGQNKVPRLSNHRQIAEQLTPWVKRQIGGSKKRP